MTYVISENIDALIFDFDGTIVDSMPVHYLSWQQAFKLNKCSFSKDFFYQHAGVSLPEVVNLYNQTYGTALSPEDVVAQKDMAHRQYLSETKVIPQVFDLIKKYHGVLPMAVATGNSKNLTEPLLRQLDLDPYFETVVFGDDVRYPKPHPECFLRAAAEMGVPASRCEVFEDGDAGLEGALLAGMKATDIRPWLNM